MCYFKHTNHYTPNFLSPHRGQNLLSTKKNRTKIFLTGNKFHKKHACSLKHSSLHLNELKTTTAIKEHWYNKGLETYDKSWVQLTWNLL